MRKRPVLFAIAILASIFVSAPSADAQWWRFLRGGADDAVEVGSKASRGADVAADVSRASQLDAFGRAPRLSRTVEHRRQASLVTANVNVRASVVHIEGSGSITIGGAGGFLAGAGFSSSGAPDIDLQVKTEVAANALQGNLAYYPVFCSRENGTIYQVPSDASFCLDGSRPLTTESPLDLSAIPIRR